MKKAAKAIQLHKEKIMSLWEEKVKKEILASGETSNLALRNQLPHVLDDVVKIMNRYNDFEQLKHDENYEEIISNSLDHGRHRATSPLYTIKQILGEYLIFHKILTETLQKENAYTAEVGIILKYSIETAMMNSATSFSDSLQEMREKLVGTLAHDMRNPLSAAYLAIDNLEYSYGEKRFEKIKT
ncbi:MAG: RsbRD N-terminal domain-containing protein, partial [Gillisia sp.]